MSDLLRKLSTELGRDAVAEANYRHPELQKCSDAHVNELLAAIERVMTVQGWPHTVEYVERAYTALGAIGELDRLREQYAPPTPAFAEKTGWCEEEFLRTAPLQEVARYLEAKHGGKP
jgi:hypothetical protein